MTDARPAGPGETGPPRRVVVVTGASSGIGRATALACAQRGDDVVLVARGEEALRRAAAECARRGGRSLVVVADVGDRESLEQVDRLAVETFGHIDAWVHSAAVMAYGTVELLPADVFDQVVQTNLVGSVNVARVALARFRARGEGTLVLLGSLLDKAAAPLMGAYVVSKWGVRGLARVLTLETRDAPGVHVAMVAPAGVNTPIYDQAASYVGVGGRPPPPVDSPERVAAAVLRTLDSPRRLRVVGPASRVVQLGFTAMPALYDLLVGPLLNRFGLSTEPTGPHRGNVDHPQSEGNELHGRWDRLGRAQRPPVSPGEPDRPAGRVHPAAPAPPARRAPQP